MLRSKTLFSAVTIAAVIAAPPRSEEHTSELQSRFDLVCRLLLEKKKHRARVLPRRLPAMATDRSTADPADRRGSRLRRLARWPRLHLSPPAGWSLNRWPAGHAAP